LNELPGFKSFILTVTVGLDKYIIPACNALF